VNFEWKILGSGGILETLGGMVGNSFTNWSKLTPRHNKFVGAIVNASQHVICTIRTKQDYVLNQKNGKYVPEKVGLKGVTRDGMDYEFTLVFDIDINHHATVSKDRTGLFTSSPEFLISSGTGKKIAKWCYNPEPIKPDLIIQQINRADSIQELNRILYQHKLTSSTTYISSSDFPDSLQRGFMLSVVPFKEYYLKQNPNIDYHQFKTGIYNGHKAIHLVRNDLYPKEADKTVYWRSELKIVNEAENLIYIIVYGKRHELNEEPMWCEFQIIMDSLKIKE